MFSFSACNRLPEFKSLNSRAFGYTLNKFAKQMAFEVINDLACFHCFYCWQNQTALKTMKKPQLSHRIPAEASKNAAKFKAQSIVWNKLCYRQRFPAIYPMCRFHRGSPAASPVLQLRRVSYIFSTCFFLSSQTILWPFFRASLNNNF